MDVWYGIGWAGKGRDGMGWGGMGCRYVCKYACMHVCMYVCVCPRLSLRFSRFYSARVAESQKDLESLTGEVSEMEKQVQLAGESRKKENDKFSRFYFAGGARTFGASCANEDTHHWLCKRTCRHAMGTVVCSLGVNTNINF